MSLPYVLSGSADRSLTKAMRFESGAHAIECSSKLPQVTHRGAPPADAITYTCDLRLSEKPVRVLYMVREYALGPSAGAMAGPSAATYAIIEPSGDHAQFFGEPPSQWSVCGGSTRKRSAPLATSRLKSPD